MQPSHSIACVKLSISNRVRTCAAVKKIHTFSQRHKVTHVFYMLSKWSLLSKCTGFTFLSSWLFSLRLPTQWKLSIITLPDSSTGTWLAERFVTDLPSVGMVVLWLTDVSSSTASDSPNPPEFRGLHKSSGEQYLIENIFQCSANCGRTIFWATHCSCMLAGRLFFSPEQISLISG